MSDCERLSDVVAYVQTEGDREYGHVVIRFGYLEDGSPRSLHCSCYVHGKRTERQKVEGLAGLEVRCQLDSREHDTACQSYGWSTEYRALFSVDYHESKLLAATLEMVHRGYERERDRLGYPATFGQYAARILGVLGVKRVLILQPSEWRGSNPGDVRHRVRSIGGEVENIDRLCRDVHAGLRLAA